MFTFPLGNGLGIRVVGGKEIPGSRGEIGAYIAKVIPGGVAEQTGKVVEGKRKMRKRKWFELVFIRKQNIHILKGKQNGFVIVRINYIENIGSSNGGIRGALI